jgi:hypothetical protein
MDDRPNTPKLPEENAPNVEVDSWDDQPGLSADWYSMAPLAGMVLAAVGVADESWGLAALGASFFVIGSWMTMNRLRSRTLSQKLLWLGVQLAVLLGTLGIALATNGWIFWAVLVAGGLLAPVLATIVSPERRAR